MDRNTYRQALVQFAEGALEIMEDHEDWNADMTEELGILARNLGLAKDNEEGYFTRVYKEEQ